MEDMLEQTNEIMETLGRPYGLPEDVDEDDLEAGQLGRFVQKMSEQSESVFNPARVCYYVSILMGQPQFICM